MTAEEEGRSRFPTAGRTGPPARDAGRSKGRWHSRQRLRPARLGCSAHSNGGSRQEATKTPRPSPARVHVLVRREGPRGCRRARSSIPMCLMTMTSRLTNPSRQRPNSTTWLAAAIDESIQTSTPGSSICARTTSICAHSSSVTQFERYAPTAAQRAELSDPDPLQALAAALVGWQRSAAAVMKTIEDARTTVPGAGHAVFRAYGYLRRIAAQVSATLASHLAASGPSLASAADATDDATFSTRPNPPAQTATSGTKYQLDGLRQRTHPVGWRDTSGPGPAQGVGVGRRHGRPAYRQKR